MEEVINEYIEVATCDLRARLLILEQELNELKNRNSNSNSLEVLTRKQVSELIGFHPNKVTELVNSGKLICLSKNRNCKMMFYKRDVIEYLENVGK
ncbi:MAG: helix-turn-helix domain-containing protein [Candidatus Kapabacteria bacterium]|nr:helix-turn-helix domain-containing protein [Candidatus Kapabacteria bacterium]